MNRQGTTRRRRINVAGAVAAAGAAGTLMVLSAGQQGTASTHTTLAGSGDAPTNTTYAQPVVSGMNVGATATWVAPPTAPSTSFAAPPLKAG